VQPRDEFDALERMLEEGLPLAEVLRFAGAIATIEGQRAEMREEIGIASTIPPALL
jgi:hypothetical protein